MNVTEADGPRGAGASRRIGTVRRSVFMRDAALRARSLRVLRVAGRPEPEGSGGLAGRVRSGLAPVRGGVPGRRFGLARRSLALRGRAHDGVGGSSKIKGIWWMPWH